MTIAKTLLLTPTRPGEGSVAEVFLRNFCQAFPRDRLVCFAARGEGYDAGLASPLLSWLPMTVHELPNEWAGEYLRLYSNPGAKVSNRRLKEVQAASDLLAQEVVKYALENKVEKVVAILAGPATIYLAKKVAEILPAAVSIVPIIWDPIEYCAENRGFDSAAIEQIMKDFALLMKRADICGVASTGMKAEIELRYGAECEVIINPVDIQEVTSPQRDDTEFRIGFAGSIYARREMETLLHALNYLQWRAEGRKLSLWILGHSFNLPIHSAASPADFRFLGFHPEDRARELLSQVDLGYLPYWFDEKFSRCVRQCFPNKLSLYLSSAIPILYHGPADSSVERFLASYPVGASCNILDTKILADTIVRLADDQSFSQQCTIARKEAVRDVLGLEPYLNRLARLLRANREDLISDTAAACNSSFEQPDGIGSNEKLFTAQQ
ncbi:MAG: hypothetical protein K2Y39_18035 [Candidatus Obscuribacterales bacterium]|nr:hypothetical protein [Candidatus Obscuribacterales bacterium]